MISHCGCASLLSFVRDLVLQVYSHADSLIMTQLDVWWTQVRGGGITCFHHAARGEEGFKDAAALMAVGVWLFEASS